MDTEIVTLEKGEFPKRLTEIPQPPKMLYAKGNLPSPELKCLTVVGSRNYSNYGKQVVEYLIQGLRGYPVAIISGLALGIDGLAHEAALSANLYTLAVPGSGLGKVVLYPRRHRMLAEQILEAGGGLLSEYPPDFSATTWSFPERNRIMVGLSHGVLVVEANEKSGTLITARLTAEYNRDLMVVPGNIFSENSKGPHQFLKLGATPVTSPSDILEVLGISADLPSPSVSETYTPEASAVLACLTEPLDRDTLIRMLKIDTQAANVLFMHMELKGYIYESNGIFYKQ